MYPSADPSYESFAGSPSTGANLPALIESVTSWSAIEGFPCGGVRPWAEAPLLSQSMNEQDRTAHAIEEAILAERNRLARELHDAVTQTLFAATILAEVLPDLWDTDEAKARQSTEDLRRLTRGALAEMRTLLFELRPAALSLVGLPDLIKQLSESLTGRKGLPVRLEVAGEGVLPCDVKVEMYRIVQESLNNIVKHACATHVEIRLRLEADRVHLAIKDNGVGFDPAAVKPTSLGLCIMRERADAIRARLQVESQPGQGTTVTLEWPR